MVLQVAKVWPDRMWIPVPKWRICPSLVQVISGEGYAWTSHSNDTIRPSITLTSSSLWPIILGGTKRENISWFCPYKSPERLDLSDYIGSCKYRDKALCVLCFSCLAPSNWRASQLCQPCFQLHTNSHPCLKPGCWGAEMWDVLFQTKNIPNSDSFLH